MADVGYLAMVAAGLGAYWWRHLRLARSRVAFLDALSPEADVALHVAFHEANARHQPLSSLHVLYGLLQDEAFASAVTTAGGDPAVLEDRVLDALAVPHVRDAVAWRLDAVALRARERGARAGCVDLFATLAELPAASLVDAAGVWRGAVLYALVHGGAPLEVPGDGPDVLVVLRNDDFTTQRFVLRLLLDVFGLPDAEAAERMLTTHREGRAVIGRFTASEARARVTAARERARFEAFPLWIGTEPT